MRYHLRLFGGCSLDGPDGPVTGRAGEPRQLTLLSLLGTSSGGVTRDKLASYLWPESASQPRHLLSDALYVLRAALGEDAICISGAMVRLQPDCIWSDVQAFLAARVTGRWREMVELYRGPFLDGFHGAGDRSFERWAEQERIRCREEAARAVRRLAEEEEREGNLGEAIALLRRGRAVDPYDERCVVRLLELLDRSGDRAGALRTYDEVRSRMLEELELEPSPEVQALAERIRSRESIRSRTPLGRLSGSPTTLPPPPG